MTGCLKAYCCVLPPLCLCEASIGCQWSSPRVVVWKLGVVFPCGGIQVIHYIHSMPAIFVSMSFKYIYKILNVTQLKSNESTTTLRTYLLTLSPSFQAMLILFPTHLFTAVYPVLSVLLTNCCCTASLFVCNL